VGKCTEGSPRAVAGVLNVVALGGLVDLGMELLLCPVNQKNYQLFSIYIKINSFSLENTIFLLKTKNKM
jgi:hypothetical protein